MNVLDESLHTFSSPDLRFWCGTVIEEVSYCIFGDNTSNPSSLYKTQLSREKISIASSDFLHFSSTFSNISSVFFILCFPSFIFCGRLVRTVITRNINYKQQSPDNYSKMSTAMNDATSSGSKATVTADVHIVPVQAEKLEKFNGVDFRRWQ